MSCIFPAIAKCPKLALTTDLATNTMVIMRYEVPVSSKLRENLISLSSGSTRLDLNLLVTERTKSVCTWTFTSAARGGKLDSQLTMI
jgi:hypothetical protein